MQGQPRAIIEMAVLHEDIMGNSPNDAVAIKIARGDSSPGNAIGTVEAHGAIIQSSAIEHFIVRFVPIDGDIFDHYVRDIGALDEGEVRCDLRLAFKMESLLETFIELETVAGGSHQSPLNDIGAFAIRVFAHQPHAI